MPGAIVGVTFAPKFTGYEARTGCARQYSTGQPFVYSLLVMHHPHAERHGSLTVSSCIVEMKF